MPKAVRNVGGKKEAAERWLGCKRLAARCGRKGGQKRIGRKLAGVRAEYLEAVEWKIGKKDRAPRKTRYSGHQ